jgi:hypothetical protein
MGENGEFTMQTPAAVLAPKQQYLNLMMNTIFKFGEICAGNEETRSRQERVGMLVRMLISYIPNPDERKRLTKLRNEKVKEAQRIKDLDLQREEVFNINCLVVGEIMELMDSILSVVERQTVIGTVVSKTTGLEEEYYPNGFTMPATEGDE